MLVELVLLRTCDASIELGREGGLRARAHAARGRGGVASDLSAERFLKLSLDSLQKLAGYSMRIVGRRDHYRSTKVKTACAQLLEAPQRRVADRDT